VTLVEDEKLLADLGGEEADFLRKAAVVQSREFLESLRADILPAFKIADNDFLNKIREHFTFSFDVNTLPQPFDKPTLFLMGRQDSRVGFADAWKIINNYPRASFVVLDRAGHMLKVEQKRLFRILAEEWLDRVEENTG
jgi:pimeloyl-ACP methyl ester carboxylesterase